MLFNHLKYHKLVWFGTRVSIFLMAVSDVLLGILEVLLGRFLPQISRELKLDFFRRLVENNNVICLQEVHGKGELLQAVQVWAHRFWLCGTFIPGNANAGGSATCIHEDLLPDDAVVTHVTTCQGRDHIVNVRSGCRNLAVVNVHLEPDLTLRSFRDILRLITQQWPLYPNAIGKSWLTFFLRTRGRKVQCSESNFHRR